MSDHMVGYIVTDADGGILRHGTCALEDLQHQARAGTGEIVLPADAAVPVDPGSQRVDLQVGCLVDHQPPAPPNDEWRTWQWSAEAKRWVDTPTELALAVPLRAERARRLAASDWVTVRAMEQGEPVPPEWIAYRQALRDVPDQPAFPAGVTWPEPPSA